MTSLNLFSTKFEQVLRLCEQRAPDVGSVRGDPPALLPQRRSLLTTAPAVDRHIFFDTPGQIEVFTWSASGALMTESLASTFPTVLLYVVDTPRSADPTTFMSNMMYACSILYKTRLPFVVVFNKTDVLNHGVRSAAARPGPGRAHRPRPAPRSQFAEEWMSDFDAFQDALDKERSKESYMTSLTRSMSLVLDEFYTNLRRVGVSAATGLGMDDLMEAIDGAVEEYRVCATAPGEQPSPRPALTPLPRGWGPRPRTCRTWRSGGRASPSRTRRDASARWPTCSGTWHATGTWGGRRGPPALLGRRRNRAGRTRGRLAPRLEAVRARRRISRRRRRTRGSGRILRRSCGT